MKRLLVPGLALTFSLVGAACSSSASVDVASQASTTAEAVGAESAQATVEAAQDAGDAAVDAAADAAEESTDAAEEATGGSTSGSGSGSSGSQAAAEALLSGDWCQSAAAIEANFDDLDVVDFTDPVALEETYSRLGEVIEAMVAIAPPQIAADVAQTAAGFAALSAELESVDWDFLALELDVLDELGPELEIASFNIEKYNFEECGIDNGFDPADDPRLNTGSSDDDGIPAGGTIRGEAIAGLVAAGFTEEEATCIFANLDLTDPAAMADSAGLLEVFEDCGIPLERLAQLGG